MTASINVDQYWCDGGKSFEMWLRAYGFKITDNNADVIVVDYSSWRKNHADYYDDSLTVILSSYSVPNSALPENTLFLLIPIDYPVVVEYIIALLEMKKTTV